MQTTTVYKTLPVKLSDPDVAKRADELASKELEKETVVAQKKMAVGGFNGKIKLLDESIAKLSRVVDKKTEDQEIACEEIRDEDRFEVRIVRRDTQEVLHERPMSASERQQVIDSKQETLFDDEEAEEVEAADGKGVAADGAPPDNVSHHGQRLKHSRKNKKNGKAKGK